MNNTICQVPTRWKEDVVKFQKSSIPRAVWQVLNTTVPYGLLWLLMYFAVQVSPWLALPLAVLAGALVVRIFIFFHDCGHGSFFQSRKANDALGSCLGILTFTPYFHWRWEHNIHHSTSGDLDRRGTGDIWTMTVQEYMESSRWRKMAYRFTRNPLVLFGLAPLFLFLVHQRFSNRNAPDRERHSVWLTNLAVAALALALGLIYGWANYLMIQITVTLTAGAIGIWMFYVQHQFEDVYWERAENWDYTAAALQGSSFYKLPKVLQWFSGNIGFHHIHHLSPRIPNYNLERCHESVPLFQQVKPITLLSSLKSLTFRLWDEKHRKLVGYRGLHQIRKEIRKQRAATRHATANAQP